MNWHCYFKLSESARPEQPPSEVAHNLRGVGHFLVSGMSCQSSMLMIVTRSSMLPLPGCTSMRRIRRRSM